MASNQSQFAEALVVRLSFFTIRAVCCGASLEYSEKCQRHLFGAGFHTTVLTILGAIAGRSCINQKNDPCHHHRASKLMTNFVCTSRLLAHNAIQVPSPPNE